MTAGMPPKDGEAGLAWSADTAGIAATGTIAGVANTGAAGGAATARLIAPASTAHAGLTPAAALAALVNHVLGQHPWARERLRACAGRTLQVSAGPLLVQWVITPEGLVGAPVPGMVNKSGPHQGFSGAAISAFDVSLRVPLDSLPLFALDPPAAMKRVRIEGDAGFAQVLAQLLREVRWDAEDDLARLTGGLAAYRLVRGARSLHAYVSGSTQRLQEMTSAFLIDEDPVLVRQSAMAGFAGEVSILRDDCARLEKRLEALGIPAGGRGTGPARPQC